MRLVIHLFIPLTIIFLQDLMNILKKCDDVVIYTDKSTSAARKEILGIFLAIFDEMDKTFKIEYVTLIEVSSTKF